MPLNSYPFNNDVSVAVADDVFVLGYPLDIQGNSELPIWKKGSIATEPYLNIGGLPKLLIDTATRPGMSGSPVIYQKTGLINKNRTGGLSLDTMIGTIQGFLGVYSGRVYAKNLFEAQIGIVWKRDVIEEIIKGEKNGTCEFHNS